MPESVEELYARVMAAADQGRLPAPELTQWDIFPWEAVDGEVAPKRVAPPAPEEPRAGEGERPCRSCAGDEGVIWEDELWRVKHLRQGGLPLVVVLETKEHLDFGELDDELASQFGRISVRLARIMEGLPGIGRVHVNRWGDGGAHFHVWYLARPAGLPQLRGSFLPVWDDILPPGPEDVWKADLAHVARKLATHGGEVRVP